MRIISLLIGVIIILIIYLVIVLYRNLKNENITKEEIVNDIKENLELDKKEEFSNINKNLEMTIGVSMKTPAGQASKDWDKKITIEIKLYDDIVPLTTQNFRKIAKYGISGKRYNKSIFHRIIPGFMIQGGDILNNDGTGSISIYGDNFKDENFRIEHNKGGLLSMANSGKNTNGSQFFITLVPTPHLDGKHVVFGEIVRGFENLKIIENAHTDINDKPYEKIEILDIKEV